MRTIYLDCSMGAAGDMITAALLELTGNSEEWIKKLNDLNIPGVTYQLTPGELLGSTIDVFVNGEEEECHDHHHYHSEEQEHHDHEHCHHHEHGEEHECHDHHHDHSEEHDHHDHEHCHHHEHGEEQECHDHHHDHSEEHDHHDHEHCHHHEHGEEHEHHGHGHHHVHHSLGDVNAIVEKLPVEDEVKKDIYAVFSLIAEAEGHVHHKPMDQIHFHEVGTMDAIADVAAVCILMHALNPDQVIASPVHVGSGRVRCAHGILPVPAPATAYILREVPIYGGEIKGELCTPTGAALLKYFVKDYASMPLIRLEASGYGLGHKKFEVTNCFTAYLGETEE